MAQRALNLALQGGGAHGAFTWGVLDRVLEEDRLALGWISATSAGAVNAVALVSGLAEGGREGARARLKSVWQAVAKAAAPNLMHLNPILHGFTKAAIGSMVGVLSPYDMNPLGFDPLRRLIEAEIDFARIRSSQGPELLIAATDISTGRARLFRRAEMSADVVLASACLPTVHHAIEIDGTAYWDGGFSANPALLALAEQSPVGDTLLVLLNPREVSGVPRGAREIAAAVNRITFSQPLLRDIEAILAVRARPKGWLSRWREQPPAHRFHLIEAGRYTEALGPDSKLKPDPAVLLHLFNAGRTEAAKWLDRHHGDIGRRETIDLAAHFLAPRAAVTAERDAGLTPAATPAENEIPPPAARRQSG